MNNINTPLFNKKTIKTMPADFRIGAVVSDGMWYDLPKWRKIAQVSEQEINDWIQQKTDDGLLIRSETGAHSYRFPLESIYHWYKENNIQLGQQLLESIFPPRIWNGLTETEGFLKAPRRKIGIVSFTANAENAQKITQELRGIARVREVEPNKYKAYCLSANYVKELIQDIILEIDPAPDALTKYKLYSRSEADRRELIDFPQKFAQGLVMFYKTFAKSLVKGHKETIQIFIPDQEDQEAQILIWVITAIEKFDEKASVPFSGYLNAVLNRWPYDIPAEFLGKELSAFQRDRSKAINAMKKKFGEDINFDYSEIAEQMDIDRKTFDDLEEKHRVWTNSRNATTLTWDENSDEKITDEKLSSNFSTNSAENDIYLANKITQAVIKTALNTDLYNDAYKIISQIDTSETINTEIIEKVSPEFIQELSYNIKID